MSTQNPSPENQPTPKPQGHAVGLVSSDLLGWFRVAEKLPPRNAIIACRAPHHTGQTMWWAGKIVEVWPQGFATMEVLEEHPRRFILTHDTEWCLLPNIRSQP